VNNLPYKKIGVVFLIGFLVILGVGSALAEPSSKIPVKGMVTLVDVGANACIPCKMMAPILEKLEKVYQGKAAVVFVDVWKNPAGAERFNIRVIPTQIFYDKKGKEVYRHEGFMSEKDIVAILEKLGVK
jgi:thioredoxin 1